MANSQTPKVAPVAVSFGITAANAICAAGNFYVGNTGWGRVAVVGTLVAAGAGLMGIRNNRRIAQFEAREAKREAVIEPLRPAHIASFVGVRPDGREVYDSSYWTGLKPRGKTLAL